MAPQSGEPRPPESTTARGRRKFTAGALEQAAQILGATSASVLVVGLVGPYVAAATGSAHLPEAAFASVAASALLIALGTALCAIVLRGLSRRANDDALPPKAIAPRVRRSR